MEVDNLSFLLVIHTVVTVSQTFHFIGAKSASSFSLSGCMRDRFDSPW